MKEIYTVINRRGGAGKTVTAHALGAGLSLKGNKVLFIDLDSQCNLSFDMGVTNASLTSMELLSGTARIEDIIAHTEIGDIIPASHNLAVADYTLTDTGKEYRLKEMIAPILDRYDYIIIDTPPSLGVVVINALTASTGAIIPAQTEIHSLQGIGLLNEALEAVRRYTNPTLKIVGILITRYNGRAILSQDMKANLELMATEIGTTIFDTPIRECVSIKEAQANQTDIFSYAPKSNGAKDYQTFIEDVLEREGK